MTRPSCFYRRTLPSSENTLYSLVHTRCFLQVGCICGCVAVVLLQPLTARAQRNEQHSDLQGTWSNGTLTPLQRPAEFREKPELTREQAVEYDRTRFEREDARQTEEFRQLQADFSPTWLENLTLDRGRTSLIIDPPTGLLPPLLPGAQARAAARPVAQEERYDNPEDADLVARCLVATRGTSSQSSPPIIPGPVFSPYYQIVQTDDYVMIYTEWVHDARIVRLHGRHLPPTIRLWLGDSIGHWEGRTLVVDTTNFRADTQTLNSGPRLHVVERFTRTDVDTIQYRVTADDPETWASPWTAEVLFKATQNPIFEFACHEGNYAIELFLKGTRFEDKAAEEEHSHRQPN